ncbi:30S ribosomal protein S13 [Candidatus Burarchaeum australiense]|nr:30S ribosomal protein S13 [Candidatus Burarchaeum australiense]
MKDEGESKAHNAPHKEHGKADAGAAQAKPGQQPQGKGGEAGGQQPRHDSKHESKRPQEQKPIMPTKDYGKDFRGVVRLAGKDMRGDVPLRRAVMRVKGIGDRLGTVLAEKAIEEMKLANDTVIGLLNDEQMKKVEEILSHPERYGVPHYLLNRQKDPETGEDRHVISTDVQFSMRQDIERDKGMNTWRGYRHLYGQKVRGQHSRTSGRSGMTVGVMRKTLMAAKEAAVAAEAKPKGGKMPGEAEKAATAPAAEAKGGKPTMGSKPAAGAKPEAKKEEKK